MTEVVEVLKKAKALIDTPDKWTKGRYVVHDLGAQYTRYCAAGAVLETLPYGIPPFRKRDDLRTKVLDTLAANIPTKYWKSVEGYNDSRKRKHADVMAWFDRAIEDASHDNS